MGANDMSKDEMIEGMSGATMEGVGNHPAALMRSTMREHRTPFPDHMSCAECGKTFDRPLHTGPRAWALRKYCSLSCAYIGMYGDLNTRFWAKVNKSGECWEWTAGADKQGYGRIRIEGKGILAHRFSYEQANGPIRDGALICHHCDNPACVRPSHLYAGTPKDNARDRMERGRVVSGNHAGEANASAKLTREQVVSMRSEMDDGRTCADVASEYGVSPNHASQIKNRKRWSHV